MPRSVAANIERPCRVRSKWKAITWPVGPGHAAHVSPASRESQQRPLREPAKRIFGSDGLIAISPPRESLRLPMGTKVLPRSRLILSRPPEEAERMFGAVGGKAR